MLKCERHDVEYCWFEHPRRNSRQVYACPVCHGVAESARPANSPFPRVRWGINFWRDRPLTEKEKQSPPRKPCDW